MMQKGCGVYLIAEIGNNHDGCLAKAKQLIDEAKESGAACVSFNVSILNGGWIEN